MIISQRKDKNLLANQFNVANGNVFSINELVPSVIGDSDYNILTFGEEPTWQGLKGSNDIVINQDSNGNLVIDASIDYFADTGMNFSEGQIGIGRIPLHDYKVDIAVPVNTRMTAIHIGDGVNGFSFGNATNSGFLPQIIGIGSDSDDAGLYFLGKTSSSEGSDIPAILFDGRNIDNTGLENRPIMGISSGSYTDYKFLIKQNGDVKIDGSIEVNNLSFIDASNNIISLKLEIEDLKARIFALENN